MVQNIRGQELTNAVMACKHGYAIGAGCRCYHPVSEVILAPCILNCPEVSPEDLAEQIAEVVNAMRARGIDSRSHDAD